MTLTLNDVIHQCGKWWISQRPDSQHQRRYDIDGKHYLMLWEGEIGAFDWFDWDNHRFSRDAVKGSHGLFKFYINSEYIDVLLSSHKLGRYKSTEELQEAMINKWIKIRLPNAQLAQQIHEMHTGVIQQTLQTIVEKWQTSSYLQKFVSDTNKKYGSINVFEHKYYLALWIGNSDAVWFGSEGFTLWSPKDYDGRPRIRPEMIKAFAGLSLVITSNSPIYYINQLVFEDSLLYLPYGTYNHLEEMLDDIRQVLNKLEFNPTT